MNIGLRTACDKDFTFARNVYFETMRWIIERLFGWDLAREDKNFAQFFKLDEVRIITTESQKADSRGGGGSIPANPRRLGA